MVVADYSNRNRNEFIYFLFILSVPSAVLTPGSARPLCNTDVYVTIITSNRGYRVQSWTLVDDATVGTEREREQRLNSNSGGDCLLLQKR